MDLSDREVIVGSKFRATLSFHNPNPLHKAAANFDSDELERLLQTRTFCPNERDNDGRTVLHVLLSDEVRGYLFQAEMEDCVRTLVEDERCDVNARDKVNECPLSLAVLHRFESIALLLVQNGADTSIRTPKFPGEHRLVSKIALTMPDVMTKILDFGISHNIEKNKPEQVSEIKLDWRPILQYPVAKTTSKKLANPIKRYFEQRETSFLYSLLDVPPTTRSLYLYHPLVAAFLHLRINKTQRSLLLPQIILLFYPVLYILYIYFLFYQRCKEKYDNIVGNHSSSSPSTTPQPNAVDHSCKINSFFIVWSSLLSIVIVLVALIDLFMLGFRLGKDLKYLKSWRGWILRGSYVIIGITLWGPLVNENDNFQVFWLYPIAALGSLTGCSLMLLQLESLIPPIRVHLEMLAGIVLGVLKVIVLFFPLLLGFYLGFSLMYKDVGGPLNYALLILEGDLPLLDELNEFDEKELNRKVTERETLWFKIVSEYFWVSFIILISIVFLNFILAVSINDISELQSNAEVRGLSHRIQTSFILNLIFPSKFNLISDEDIKAGNWIFTYRPSDEQCPTRNMLNKNIRKAIIQHIKDQKNSANDKKTYCECCLNH